MIKRIIKLKDEHGTEFECDWLTSLVVRNENEIWIVTQYGYFEVTDEKRNVEVKSAIFERYITKCETRHSAICRIREFQEQIQD